MKITKQQLRTIIKEEKAKLLKESISDMSPVANDVGLAVSQIADAFADQMSALWDEDPAMMRGQGYTNRSEWDSQVGSAELALEEALQDAINEAIQKVETALHDGQYYDSRGR